MIKLKKLIKEGSPGFTKREFGDPLPTFSGVMKQHQNSKKPMMEKKELGGAMINTIDRLTDSNNHNEARLQLAKSFLGKNSPLVKSYEALIVLHNQMNQMNDLMKVREKLDKMLFTGAKRTFSDYDAIEGAF